MVLVEICTDNLTDTIDAIRAGADRIELCADLANDGLTPSGELLDQALELGKVHNVVIFPMIRCRSGDFVYTQAEKETMIDQAVACVRKGVPGLVVGATMQDGSIDIDFIRLFTHAVHAVAPATQITFHKAIDAVVLKPGQQLVDVVAELEPFCERILTSGGHPTAMLGAEAIRQMSDSNARPYPMAAGKVRADNVLEVIERTGVREVHGRSVEICIALGKPTRSV